MANAAKLFVVPGRSVPVSEIPVADLVAARRARTLAVSEIPVADLVAARRERERIAREASLRYAA